MNRTYHAVLIGDHLEWKGSAPNVSKPTEVRVEVADPEDEATARERRGRAAAALRKLAAMGGIKSIPDPVAWQREMRKDRPLHGREE